MISNIVTAASRALNLVPPREATRDKSRMAWALRPRTESFGLVGPNWYYAQIIRLASSQPPLLELSARTALWNHYRREYQLSRARR